MGGGDAQRRGLEVGEEGSPPPPKKRPKKEPTQRASTGVVPVPPLPLPLVPMTWHGNSRANGVIA